MALTVGVYVRPSQAHAVAIAAIVALTAVNYAGVQKSARLTLRSSSSAYSLDRPRYR